MFELVIRLERGSMLRVGNERRKLSGVLVNRSFRQNQGGHSLARDFHVSSVILGSRPTNYRINGPVVALQCKVGWALEGLGYNHVATAMYNLTSQAH